MTDVILHCIHNMNQAETFIMLKLLGGHLDMSSNYALEYL